MALFVSFDLSLSHAPRLKASEIEWWFAHYQLSKDWRRNSLSEAQLTKGFAE